MNEVMPTLSVEDYDLEREEHILFPRDPIHDDAGRLAEFLALLRYEDIPPEVLEQARLTVLDTIGCIVTGAMTPLGQRLLVAYGQGAGEGNCCVPGTDVKLPPSLAAKLSAWLSDVLDFEDTASGHPSATVIPAAMAVAEHLGASAELFLAGVVAGYEAGLRVHDATQASEPVFKRLAVYHAWHGVAGGAAAMVVSGGTAEQFRSALGHAAANTSLPLWYVQYGRPAHALKANYGQMALGGVDAALCARQDIIGPFAMFSDPERGFAQLIGSDNFYPERLSAGLGQVWRFEESYLKEYPACAYLHTTADAIKRILRETGIEPADVQRVRLQCFSRIPNWFSNKAPQSDIDAQLSIEYVATMALLSVEPGRDWYAPALMSDPAVAEMMQRIDVETDPIADEAFWRERRYRSTVTIVTTGGASHVKTVDWPPGHATRRFTTDEIVAKFLHNVKGTALEPNGGKVVDIVTGLGVSATLPELWKALRNA